MHPDSSLSERQREAAVALFDGGYGAKAVATRLGVSRAAVRRLRGRWQLRGAGALIMKPTKRSFSFEFKLDLVRAVVDGRATAAELARAHDLSSPTLVENWVRRYRRDGEEALQPKRRGRPPGTTGSPAQPLSELDRLRQENLRLAAENAYLKKVRALRAQGRD